jgi:hypothetical protein
MRRCSWASDTSKPPRKVGAELTHFGYQADPVSLVQATLGGTVLIRTLTSEIRTLLEVCKRTVGGQSPSRLLLDAIEDYVKRQKKRLAKAKDDEAAN